MVCLEFTSQIGNNNEEVVTPQNNYMRGVYQPGYVDNGRDEAPVRRDAETGRERTVIPPLEANNADDDCYQRIAATQTSSESVRRQRVLKSTKIAANRLVELQEVIVGQKDKKEVFDRKLQKAYLLLKKESIRYKFLKLNILANKPVNENALAPREIDIGFLDENHVNDSIPSILSDLTNISIGPTPEICEGEDGIGFEMRDYSRNSISVSSKIFLRMVEQPCQYMHILDQQEYNNDPLRKKDNCY